ncbi:hypothetical protein ILUMI_24385 [Ignelater luminosus]|uniref:Peptidase S1 domain-containing protein n=1 Tax=Ignelater luminosus TaxID=2038154 RepID=A0A8K0FWL2_IGNLU|nr:hypothetical protein ILUMI_24385 [Ignelater luminosus]
MLFVTVYFWGLYFASLLVNGSPWRIIGGRPVEEGELPYQVSLRRSYNDNHFCGGSIISSLHILTAAHCMFYSWGGVLPPIVVSVFAGQVGLSPTETSIYRNASKIITHEDFNKTTFANDVAIIELDRELPISKLISSVAMREVSITSGKCIVSGWGYQEHESGIVSETLLAAEVDIIEFSKCQEMYNKDNMTLVEGMLCAGHEKGETDACQGDSGGPLVCDGLLTGVVSTGAGCGEPDFPGIYADVAKYLPWVNSHVVSTQTTTITNEETTYLTETEADDKHTHVDTTAEATDARHTTYPSKELQDYNSKTVFLLDRNLLLISAIIAIVLQ